MTSTRALTLYTAAFVDELTKSGLKHAVISPGSRSTPMSMVMAEHPDMNVWLEIDERSAGFFALGRAKASREPVALVCTSGTAAANYMPAVVEAYLSRIPLVVITTDRPHELRDVGAPQAIDQLNLFGKYAKWFVEMALPEEGEGMLRYARTFAGRAVATSIKGPQGVVHLNFPYREPLIPDFTIEGLFDAGRANRDTYVKASHGKVLPDSHFVDELVQVIQQQDNGLIICGPHDDPEMNEAVIAFAKKVGYPILADPLSQLRSGKYDTSLVVDSYDTFLREERFGSTMEPSLIIRFGAMPVSKALLHYLKRHKEARQIIIDEDGGWREPTLLASDMVYVSPTELFRMVLDELPGDGIARTTGWTDQWINVNKTVRQVLLEDGRRNHLFEGQIMMELVDLLPEQSILFAGNSMPIRDLDSFFLNNSKQIRTMANRGANGIDGVVSSALGASTIGVPLVLVIGDLSFYHDLNGLLAAKLHKLNATIIVINNDGGGIFSFLPQANHPKHFEALFGTSTGLDFSHAVKMYGGRFHRALDWEQFRDAVQTEIETDGLSVIEVPTTRHENAVDHRALWDKAYASVRKFMAEAGK